MIVIEIVLKVVQIHLEEFLGALQEAYSIIELKFKLH